jgi:hypothetical protein
MTKFGADPELFVYDPINCIYVSSHNLVKGDKRAPFAIEDGATQVDGVSAEFNITPSETAEEFSRRIESVKNGMLKMIRGNKGAEHYVLRATPVAYFNADYFSTLPEETRALGCEPDFNAYTGEQNDPPGTTEPFRTGSGHVHVGDYEWKGDYKQDTRNRVKQLDYTLYPLSLLWDKDLKRRELYGKPGAFRYKPYGFEYRVLSNKWVGSTNLQKWIMLATKRAMDLFDEGEHLYDDVAPETTYQHDYLLNYANMLVQDFKFPELRVG